MSAAAHPPKDDGSRLDLGDGIAALVLWLPYAWLVHRFWFVTDDAFISFRYARNWAGGLGLRYNAGEDPPVEGFSNFLWVVVATPLEWLGAAPENALPWLSFLCGSALIAWLFLSLRRRFAIDRVGAVVACAFVAWSPAFALHSSTGLETIPFALLLYALFDRLVLRSERIDVFVAVLGSLALALMRVEGIVWSFAILALAAISRRLAGRAPLKPLAVHALLLFVGAGFFLGMRYAYFDDLVSNTVHAKASLSVPGLLRGASYVIHFLLTFVAPLGLLLGVPACLARPWRSVGLPILAAAAGSLVFAVGTGGDFMAMGRFLVAGLPFVALAVGLGFAAAGERRTALLSVAGALLAVGLLPAWDQHLIPDTLRTRFHIHGSEPYLSDYERWEFQRDNALRWERLGRALKEHARPGSSVVLGAIGAAGYFSELTVYDEHGLVDREVAHRPSATLSLPGHDKQVSPGFFLPRRPGYLFAELSDGASSAQVADALESHAATLRAAKLDREYVAKAVETRFRDRSGNAMFLLLSERLAPGEIPQRAWQRTERTLRRLRGAEAVTTDSPAPNLP